MPYEVPENWVWTTLGEICLFLSRGKSPKYSDTDKTYPVFAQKCNLKEGGISLEQARFLDPSTICKWSEEYKLKTGDVLVNSTGTGTVGRTRLFHESYLKHYPFAVPDSHVSVIRTASEIKSEFVFAYNCRSLKERITKRGLFSNKYLNLGILTLLIVQAIVFFTPIGKIFGLTIISLSQFIYVILINIISFIILEILKPLLVLDATAVATLNKSKHTTSSKATTCNNVFTNSPFALWT